MDEKSEMDARHTSLEQLAASLQSGGMPQPSVGAGVDKFFDLELPLSVIVGRREMNIEEVLKLTSGSVIELDKATADRVEVVVQGRVVAYGEVVSVNGNYGVRITQTVVPVRETA